MSAVEESNLGSGNNPPCQTQNVSVFLHNYGVGFVSAWEPSAGERN
jgi:hypothetical protein